MSDQQIDALLPAGFTWSEAEERPVYTHYTARETADALGVAERTVRRWIAAGRLSGEKKHGEFRINMDEARKVFNESRGGYTAGRAAMEGYIARLEQENARLWRLLEKAISPATAQADVLREVYEAALPLARNPLISARLRAALAAAQTGGKP